MIGTPKLENRKAQPYLGIRTRVMPNEIAKVLPVLHGRLADWMERKKIDPSGPLFFRYFVIDSERGFDMEVGVPVENSVSGEGDIEAKVLPEGCYATLLHTGHFSGLRLATAALLAWGEENGVVWQRGYADGGEAWEARLESYLNVGLQKDPEKWQTELAFLTA